MKCTQRIAFALRPELCFTIHYHLTKSQLCSGRLDKFIILSLALKHANLIYLFTVLLSASAWADLNSKVESVDHNVHSDLHRLADRVDHIFGTSREDDNKSTSTLRLSAEESIEDGRTDNPSFGVRFNLKLATLQRWNDELNQWFNRKIKKLESEFEPSHKPSKAGENSKAGKAEAPQPEEKDPWRFSIEKKFVVARDPSGYAKARMSKDFESKYIFTAFSLEAGWSSGDLWGSRISLVSSHHLSNSLLLSFGNSAYYAISAKNFTTGHGPALAYVIADNQALTLGFSVGTSVVDKNWSAQSYTLAAGYRLEAWNELLYFTLNPYLAFGRNDRFHGTPGLSTSLEIVF